MSNHTSYDSCRSYYDPLLHRHIFVSIGMVIYSSLVGRTKTNTKQYMPESDRPEHRRFSMLTEQVALAENKAATSDSLLRSIKNVRILTKFLGPTESPAQLFLAGVGTGNFDHKFWRCSFAEDSRSQGVDGLKTHLLMKKSCMIWETGRLIPVLEALR